MTVKIGNIRQPFGFLNTSNRPLFQSPGIKGKGERPPRSARPCHIVGKSRSGESLWSTRRCLPAVCLGNGGRPGTAARVCLIAETQRAFFRDMQVYFNRGQPDPKISAPCRACFHKTWHFVSMTFRRGVDQVMVSLTCGEVKMLHEILETSTTHPVD